MVDVYKRQVYVVLKEGAKFSDVEFAIKSDSYFRNDDTRGDESGYQLTTWGGTVGMDVDINDRFTAGEFVAALWFACSFVYDWLVDFDFRRGRLLWALFKRIRRKNPNVPDNNPQFAAPISRNR